MASSSRSPVRGSQLFIESHRRCEGDDRDGLEQQVRPQTIERRVETLERRVTKLEKIPAMVEGVTGQILQLRAEMASEFSAVRREARAAEKKLRHEIGRMHEHEMKEIIDRGDNLANGIITVRQELHGFREEMRSEMHEVRSAIDEVRSGLKAIHDRLPPR